MTMNYRGGAYNAAEENPYAVDRQVEGDPFRRGSYDGSMPINFQPMMTEPSARPVGWQAGEELGERQARIQRDSRVASEDTAEPVRQGFRVSRDGQDVFSGEGEASAQAMGQLSNQALEGQANYIDSTQQHQNWLARERRNIRAFSQQKEDAKKADSRKKKGGGLLGAIGGIAGSLIGGPIGGIIGGVSSLFG